MRSWTPKAKRRAQKSYTSGLTPAQIREWSAELDRQMALGTKGGRPKLLKGRVGGVLTGVQREKIRQANIAAGIARRKAKREQSD